MAELVESYPLFEWDKSNGVATAAQTRKAHTAASEQGQCADFSRYVWNDIVDTLGKLLADLGLSWDGRYTTQTGAKITALYGQLTAEKFNSVRHNIQVVAFTTWRWQFDYLKEGYTGRNDFRGVRVYGTNSDRVYGWYIIELVRKLNVAIELMRGTWPTEELDLVYTAASHSDAQMPVRPSVKLPAVGLSASKAAQALNVTGIAPLPAVAAEGSDGKGKLLAIPIIGLPAKGTAESEAKSHLGLIPTRPMTAVLQAGSAPAVELYPAPAVGMAYSKIHESYSKAEFVASMRSISLKPDATSESKAETVLRVPMAVSLPVIQKVESMVVAEFTAKDVETLAVVTRAASAVITSLDALGRAVFGASVSAESHGKASAVLREPVHLAAKGTGQTDGKAKIIRLPPLPVSAVQLAGTASKTEIVPGVPRAIRATCKTESFGKGGVATLPGSVFGGVATGESSAKAGMATRGLAPLAAADTVSSFGKAAFIPMTPTHIAAGLTAVSASDAVLRTGAPVRIAATATAGSDGKGALLHRPPLPVAAVRIAATAASTALEAVQSMAVRAKAKAKSYAVAALDFIIPEKDWYDPVQSGSNLYIRSVGLFWRDGKKGYIDVAEFYPPVREGSNLYIRSADRFWTDGSSGNIDTDVFLEPVQDGSNLYIRQNIFWR